MPLGKTVWFRSEASGWVDQPSGTRVHQRTIVDWRQPVHLAPCHCTHWITDHLDPKWPLCSSHILLTGVWTLVDLIILSQLSYAVYCSEPHVFSTQPSLNTSLQSQPYYSPHCRINHTKSRLSDLKEPQNISSNVFPLSCKIEIKCSTRKQKQTVPRVQCMYYWYTETPQNNISKRTKKMLALL